MRLQKVENEHRLLQKFVLKMMESKMGQRVPDVIRVMLYRPEFFGQYFSAYIQEALRRGTAWSVGELELFAAFVSRKNKCAF